MPEGDTVHRHAAQLAPILVGQGIVFAASRWPAVVAGLVGTEVEAVEAVGKHLLIGLADATTLRVHLGMPGKWRLSPAWADPTDPPRDVSLRLDTALGVAMCTRAPTVERFRTRERPVHRSLRWLGPDVLAPGFEPQVAAARAVAADHDTLAEVLLDQRVACGIGNVYKSEVLFLAGLDPFARPHGIDLEAATRLYTLARDRMRANLGPGPRDTTGLGSGRPLHWVYGRKGRPCLRCGTRVAMRRHGRSLARTTFWCGRCQSVQG